MPALAQDIERWLDKMYADPDITHVVVVCDDFDWEDYPVYVTKDEDVRKVEAQYRGKSMQRIMEIYSRNHTKEGQMKERRAFHRD